LAAAETAVLGKQTYKLWHNPDHVIDRCKLFIKSGAGFPSIQETVLASNTTRLAYFSYVRHRIVHEQEDAKNKFDGATIALAGQTYSASRPGRFLRDRSPSGQRWVDAIANELIGIVGQIV
jgi:hypothetical protein